MDQSLKDFRAAVQEALTKGDLTHIATNQVQGRLTQSPGWTSARRSSEVVLEDKERHAAKRRSPRVLKFGP